MASLKKCAENAGIKWEGIDGLGSCSGGVEGIRLLQVGAKPLLAAMKRLHNALNFTVPPPLPWVLLDGNLLSCDGHNALCNSRFTPVGLEPLPQAGTLLHLVCSRLNPLPEECLTTRKLDFVQNKMQICQDCLDPAARQDWYISWRSQVYILEFSLVVSFLSALVFREIFKFRPSIRRPWLHEDPW